MPSFPCRGPVRPQKWDRSVVRRCSVLLSLLRSRCTGLLPVRCPFPLAVGFCSVHAMGLVSFTTLMILELRCCGRLRSSLAERSVALLLAVIGALFLSHLSDVSVLVPLFLQMLALFTWWIVRCPLCLSALSHPAIFSALSRLSIGS
jgi:hypothetical protein